MDRIEGFWVATLRREPIPGRGRNNGQRVMSSIHSNHVIHDLRAQNRRPVEFDLTATACSPATDC